MDIMVTLSMGDSIERAEVTATIGVPAQYRHEAATLRQGPRLYGLDMWWESYEDAVQVDELAQRWGVSESVLRDEVEEAIYAARNKIWDETEGGTD